MITKIFKSEMFDKYFGSGGMLDKLSTKRLLAVLIVLCFIIIVIYLVAAAGGDGDSMSVPFPQRLYRYVERDSFEGPKDTTDYNMYSRNVLDTAGSHSQFESMASDTLPQELQEGLYN